MNRPAYSAVDKPATRYIPVHLLPLATGQVGEWTEALRRTITLPVSSSTNTTPANGDTAHGAWMTEQTD